MNRLLVTARASPSDAKYADQKIEGVSFSDYVKGAGIETRDIMTSCHGNPLVMQEAVSSLQALAKHGYKVVMLGSGGLNLAKHSLESAWAGTLYRMRDGETFTESPVGNPRPFPEPARFPIFAVPTDKFAAASVGYVPSGTAAVATVGVNNYASATRIGKALLTEEANGVYTFEAPPKLTAQLEKLKVPVLGEANTQLRTGIVVGSCDPDDGDFGVFDKSGSVAIVTSPDVEDANNLVAISDWIDQMSERHHVAWTRGPENVAYMAARAVMQTTTDDKLRETIWQEMLRASAKKALDTGYTGYVSVVEELT